MRSLHALIRVVFCRCPERSGEKKGGQSLLSEELEDLADRVYAAYEALPEADGLRVDPELLAEKLLGLRVV